LPGRTTKALTSNWPPFGGITFIEDGRMYTLKLNPNWGENFKKFDHATQQKIMKKIEKQQEETKTRHLKHGLEFYVIEIGQWRAALKINEKEKTKTVCFIGNHKQYERWYKSKK